ncbi:rod shape-determining protein MreC [bacterium C-53]|nr:rod shape-determining protein MreC [Lachnospiraceae bacterium]NBI01910.1 rod shape-determining protein MreC [Lachnospiraceae bacterium]RKJ12313.1 rod shape-determining protein MreC [bacterium C-53]
MPRVKIKRRKFVMPSKYILLIMSILCVGMMILTFTTDIVVKPLSIVSGYVLVPFQEGISEVGMWFTKRSDELKQLRDVMAENEALQAKIDELSIENSNLLQDKYELTKLRELYELDEKYEEYEKVGARVIGKDPGNWFSVFLIDKGSSDGIEVNMNVMAGSGLVGIVTQVGTNWATVRTVIDDASNVSAMVLSTSDRLVVTGDLQLMESGVIRFAQLKDEDDSVVKGDQIVTSNISDKFLPGITIGYINEINTDSNNLTKSGTIAPIVDFDHLDVVLVVKQLKQQKE